MSEDQENLFPIKLSRKLIGKEYKFENFDEVSNWTNEELQKFDWIKKHPEYRNHQLAPVLYQHISNIFQTIINSAVRGKQRQQALQSFSSSIEQLNQLFLDNYGQQKLISTVSVLFKKTVEISEVDYLKAIAFLAAAIKFNQILQYGQNQFAVLDGVNEYFFYAKSLNKGNVQAEKQALVELKNEWDEVLVDAKDNQKQWNSDITATKKELDIYIEQKQEVHKSNLKAWEDKLNEQDEKFIGLQAAYREHMSLRAPVDYWSGKEQFHKKRIVPFTAASVILGLIGGHVLMNFTVDLLYDDVDVVYWKIALLIILGTLFFWVLRILVKLLLSHIHLRSDAQERQVMVKTYLSLLTEDSKLNENDRYLILMSLFRPNGAAGLIKDDGIPPGVYEAITRAISK